VAGQARLDGKDLPWVESADHLGHTLHQMTNMEKDCQRASGKFIAKTLEIREQLALALSRSCKLCSYFLLVYM
jgi:hypothetical protein